MMLQHDRGRMSDFPKINSHLIRSVAKSVLKEKKAPKEDLEQAIAFVRATLIAERKYLKKAEARNAKAQTTPPDTV